MSKLKRVWFEHPVPNPSGDLWRSEYGGGEYELSTDGRIVTLTSNRTGVTFHSNVPATWVAVEVAELTPPDAKRSGVKVRAK